ncbi:hypothetical protein OOT33_12920 [Sphingobium sp. DEHP117]|nr:hypothetical protein [Sphingobium sp. DEHP117]MDQ4421324.1 hypothetical protein [Sphingobium sp. DEHP117]
MTFAGQLFTRHAELGSVSISPPWAWLCRDGWILKQVQDDVGFEQAM